MALNKHILVVEDEAHLAEGIKFNLQAEGYEVTAVADGNAAIQQVESNEQPPDLIVLDLMLPGMSGYRVCETLREGGYNMPVLILSARTLPEDRTRGFDVGADQYLTKPFELDELISRVKNLLTRYQPAKTRPATSNNSEFEFGTAKINFETHEVIISDKEIRMTPLELKLLQYFVQNEGRVIPRGELLQNVWDMPATVKTRAVDQFIRRLRKLFEPKPTEPKHFLTIRDAGYRFVSGTGAAH